MNALSVLFPEGEQFFVDSVRAFRDQINDPKLKAEVRGFIGQEAMHSLEHITMNQHVRDQGMPVEEMEKDLKVILDLARKLPKRHQLAVTCALEHITAMMGDMLRGRANVVENMNESMRPWWVGKALRKPSTRRWPTMCSSRWAAPMPSARSTSCSRRRRWVWWRPGLPGGW